MLLIETCLLLNKTCQSLGLYSRVNLPAILAKTRHSAQRQHSPIVARDYRIGIVDVLTYLGNRRNLSEKLRSSNSPNVLRNSPLIINVHWPLFNSTLNRAADQAKQIHPVPGNWKTLICGRHVTKWPWSISQKVRQKSC